MDQFIILFRHQDGKEVASPEQMQEWMKQVMDWIAGIDAQQKFVSGTGFLFEEARVVTNSNSQLVVSNGAFGGTGETLGGFVIVMADSVEEAVAFAKTRPILQGEGNRVEVRKIAKDDGVH